MWKSWGIWSTSYQSNLDIQWFLFSFHPHLVRLNKNHWNCYYIKGNRIVNSSIVSPHKMTFSVSMVPSFSTVELFIDMLKVRNNIDHFSIALTVFINTLTFQFGSIADVLISYVCYKIRVLHKLVYILCKWIVLVSSELLGVPSYAILKMHASAELFDTNGI